MVLEEIKFLDAPRLLSCTSMFYNFLFTTKQDNHFGSVYYFGDYTFVYKTYSDRIG